MASADEKAGDHLDRLLGGRQADAQQRALAERCRAFSDSAKWEPRLFGASAWISSTITVRVVARHFAAGLGAEQDV